MIIYRQAKARDEQLLRIFLYHAIYIPEGCEPPSADIVFTEDFIQYTEAFGTNPLDLGITEDFIQYTEAFGTNPLDPGIVAEDNGNPVGVAWVRLMKSYGYVDNDTPELSISLLPEYRGKGIGTVLLSELLDSLKMKNCRYVSLSVQKANTAALRLYRKAGFRIVEDKGDELVMKIDLENNEAVFAVIK